MYNTVPDKKYHLPIKPLIIIGKLRKMINNKYPTILYLEISGRRSGKTTRLLQAADRYLTDNKSISIHGVSKQVLPEQYMQYWHCETENTDIVLIDEFEFVDWQSLVQEYDTYIAGTPKWESESADLLEEMFPHYINARSKSPNLTKTCETLGHFDYKAEVQGEFR